MSRDLGWKFTNAWDYFHINSVDKDPESNYYISSRYAHTITCIGPTGEVKWILGGKRNQFTDLSGGIATDFSWQHHASWHPNNTITIFDNGSTDKVKTAKHSRGMAVSVNTTDMTATLLAQYNAPEGFLSASQGSVQILPESGNVFVGWGHQPEYTEFTSAGEVLCDVRFGSRALFNWGWVKSYRTFRSTWVGRPKTIPSIVIDGAKQRVFVSWNGATEVSKWTLQSAESVNEEDSINYEMFDVETVRKETFETEFELPSDCGYYVRIVALDAQSRPLGYTLVVDVRSGNMISEEGDIIYAQKDDTVSTTLFFVAFAIMTAAMFVGLFWEKVSSRMEKARNWRKGFVRLSKDEEDKNTYEA